MKYTDLILFQQVSMCITFPRPVDYSLKSHSRIPSFDNFKFNETELKFYRKCLPLTLVVSEHELNVTNLELACLCGSFTKEKYFMETFGENC